MTSAGQGFQWGDALHEAGLGSSECSRKDVEESSGLRQVMISLLNVSRVLDGRASPSAASFFFFSWHKFFSQAEIPSLHRAWRGFSFTCSILYVISLFRIVLPSHHPTLPPLFIQLTDSERQKCVSAGGSVVKCISSEVVRHRYPGEQRDVHMRCSRGRVGVRGCVGSGDWERGNRGTNASVWV